MVKDLPFNEKDNFEDLRAEIKLSFETGHPVRAIPLIKNLRYGSLIAQETEEGVTPLFEVIRDEVQIKDLNDSWERVTRVLEKLLAAVQGNWSQQLLDKAVNFTGITHSDEEGKPVRETMRDIIVNDPVYKNNEKCKRAFDKIFDKYRMMTKQEVLTESLKPSSKHTGIQNTL